MNATATSIATSNAAVKPTVAYPNPEQQLYVIPTSGGFSCWGFSNCYEETYALALVLKQEPPAEGDFGTMKVYERHAELMKYVHANNINLGTWFNWRTPLAIRHVIEELRRNRRRVRIFTGNPQTGKVSNNEHDVIGSIGRSTGRLAVPLLINNGRSTGGGAIMTDRILRIVDVATKRDLYRSEKYTESTFEVVDASNLPGYISTVKVDGEVCANFKAAGQAERWVEFMKGNRMCK